MKQVLQELRTGNTIVADVPRPAVRSGCLLVRTEATLISVGTERMLVEFGKANLVQKARQQPDKVRMVIDKIGTDGLGPTLQSVQAKLDQPLPMGYSNVGTVIDVGEGVRGFDIGDRVVSNGNHAEVVCVPENLCAKVPAGINSEVASFAVVGAIGLQGIRLIQPTLGENVVVTGLGLIGLITVQLLKANGCSVLGIDPDPGRSALAESFGATTVNLTKGESPLEAAARLSDGNGVDAVIITASTKSNEPVHQAAQMCRKRGRIVLVGVTGLELSRADFYEKELSFQVSCSYGPGRYDPAYEKSGQDYPIGFVRWTEQRNFQAVLGLIDAGQLDVELLISHRFPIAEARDAYRALSEENPLGIVLDYPSDDPEKMAASGAQSVTLRGVSTKGSISAGKAVTGVIGAGGYASKILIPALKRAGANLHSLASAGGVSSVYVGKKFSFERATTDSSAVIEDAGIDTVVVATRHDTHAAFTAAALDRGKHVFVEKPLALDREQLADVVAAYQKSRSAQSPLLMIGFNRRFSPLIVKLLQLLESRSEPKSFVMTVNAGEIASDHWTQDPDQGGGRIIGEGCHFIDLLRFLAGAPIRRAQSAMLGRSPGLAITDDKATFTLEFENGSFGTVHYLANGHRSFPKERLEVFCGGGILQIDNFRRMRGYGWPGFRRMTLRSQNKGNSECVAAFVDAVKQGRASPIPFDEIVEVTETSFDIMDQLRS